MKKFMRVNQFEIFMLSLFACFLSFLKFNQCRADEFSGASNIKYFCYSDIPSFWESRALKYHTWPFTHAQVPEIGSMISPIEYPVIVGMVIWLLSYLTSTTGIAPVNFFDVNVVFLSLLFASSSIYLYKIRQKYISLIIFTPAVVLSLFINWDMWAVLPTILAIYYFDRLKNTSSGICLAVAVSAKFYPIVLLVPSLIILLRNKSYQAIRRYIISFVTTYLILNLPFAITNFNGWSYFFEFSFNRGTGYGSIWEAFEVIGIEIPVLNLFYFLSSMFVFLSVSIFVWKYSSAFKLREIAFLFVFAFTIFSKVYSPQYILWLTPLAILALNSKKQIRAFFVWQIFELAYHLAIWRYLYFVAGGQEMIGVTPEIYVIISFSRVLTMTLFAWSIISPILRVKTKSSN